MTKVGEAAKNAVGGGWVIWLHRAGNTTGNAAVDATMIGAVVANYWRKVLGSGRVTERVVKVTVVVQRSVILGLYGRCTAKGR